jgi:carbon-monoxide dehydrogenase small subunit
MTPIQLTVNGRPIADEIEPRTHLADFLREKMNLTGTHLRCEQGVCGACTLLIDGQPARSCITYAVMCDGAEVTTIEGLDDDPAMVALRRAFSQEHGLQCGFCTPAMLMTARDILMRLPDADEARIRVELSGNLCRCTGYVGIVRAIRRVLKEYREGALTLASPADAPLGPVGARAARAVARASSTAIPSAPDAGNGIPAQTVLGLAGRSPNVEMRQSFSVSRSPEEVWIFLADIEQVVRCLPGARLSQPPDGNKMAGTFSAKLGPITARFDGEALIVRHDGERRGVILGAGRDRLGGSRAGGELEYLVVPSDRGTRVDVVIRALLAGPLAQFGRSGIVDELVARIVEEFARRLEDGLSGRRRDIDWQSEATLPAGSLLRQVFMVRLRRILSALLGRSRS